MSIISGTHQGACKILISGAFCTGKTTLCSALLRAVEATGLRASVVTESARRCPYPLHSRQTPSSSAWPVGEQMKAEVEAMAGGNGIVICDRGVPDILAHMRTAMAAEATGDRLASVVSNICFQWTKTYDMIFMTQPVPDRPIRRDGFRRWGKVKQIETHKALLSIMKSLMVVAILLPSADDERLLIIGGMLGLLDGDA